MRKIKALIDGIWQGDLVETPEVRSRLAEVSGFQAWVSVDGSSGYAAEPSRYHLYVSYACPWAHRTILYRRLKGLENVISMSVLHPRWGGPHGWCFREGDLGTVDHAGGKRFLHEIYAAADPNYTGRVTVPVLWDKTTGRIVNNHSASIMRMLNSAFDEWGDGSIDFYPEALRQEIDAMNRRLIPDVCAGVYRAGFASSQEEYERAARKLFQALGELDELLGRQRYLCGPRLTESDWHLFCTLCRFDAVYYTALKCNLRRLIDYPALSAYARRIHALPGVAETVRFDHMKLHYFDAIGEIDPTIVPIGPVLTYLDGVSLDQDRMAS